MQRVIKSSTKFDKAYRKFVRSYPYLQKSIDDSIKLLEKDAFSPNLDTHKLSGNLYGLLACSCGYDCRIVFSIEKEAIDNKEYILLLDIGTHEEVY